MSRAVGQNSLIPLDEQKSLPPWEVSDRVLLPETAAHV